MNKIVLFLFILAFANANSQQINGPMQSVFASPVVEEGKRNIILQNRCGNRLTLLIFDDKTSLEFIYKPNAFRRKEYRARNFSSRDNFTRLFADAQMPMISASNITNYEYDPFTTRLKSKTKDEAKNEITIVTIADENMFAISAKSPTVITFRPHKAFAVSNGLLTEKFTDRGEDIVSFISFGNMEQNRLRILNDGTYVLQIFENEVVLAGGEENEYQVNRAIGRFRNMPLHDIIAYNEMLLAPKMNQGVVTYSNPDFQKVLDLNHRIVYSGIDEGGACFGALNRIYYLIWVRDGSMTSSLMARAGNTELIKIWAPFLLGNPNVLKKEDGTTVNDFLQIVGTRWTRNEDDGIYFAAMSLYTYFKTTGQDDLLRGKELGTLIQAIDRNLEKNWKPGRKMIISNTIGETPLKDDPYFGYDVVNGNYEHNSFHMSQGKELKLVATLYMQVNMYNVMMMAAELLAQRPDLDRGHAKKYLAIAGEIRQTLRSEFIDKTNDCLYSAVEFYSDNTEGKLSFKTDNNPWEGSWACAIGPFFPAPDLQLKTARVIYDTWPKIAKQGYGYCPWNTLSNMLYEYGMSSSQYEQMLSQEIREANMLSTKYPMPGAITEYANNTESWRGLPFSAGSLFFTISAQMLQSLPSGIAVRSSNKADSMKNFRYKLSTINVSAGGTGDAVVSYKLNGKLISSSLQIPESRLAAGQNFLEVVRGLRNESFRLYSSSAQLTDIAETGNSITYSLNSIVPIQVYFENIAKAKSLEITGSNNEKINFTSTIMPGTNITLLDIDAAGQIKVNVSL